MDHTLSAVQMVPRQDQEHALTHHLSTVAPTVSDHLSKLLIVQLMGDGLLMDLGQPALVLVV